MKIAMINGSPKTKASNSSVMLKTFESFLMPEDQITYYHMNTTSLCQEQYLELCQADVLLFAFPLYIDAIPSHLFQMLVNLESYFKSHLEKDIYVYAIINNGFYEGHQNNIAIDILENWCIKAGVNFGMAIGQGAGEMMGFLEQVPIGHGPLKNLGKAMESLAEHMHTKTKGDSMLFSPNYPKFAWKFTATHMFWNTAAKKNGLRKKDII